MPPKKQEPATPATGRSRARPRAPPQTPVTTRTLRSQGIVNVDLSAYPPTASRRRGTGNINIPPGVTQPTGPTQNQTSQGQNTVPSVTGNASGNNGGQIGSQNVNGLNAAPNPNATQQSDPSSVPNPNTRQQNAPSPAPDPSTTQQNSPSSVPQQPNASAGTQTNVNPPTPQRPSGPTAQQTSNTRGDGTPDPDPGSDPAGNQGPDNPPSFWETFWVQVSNGFAYLATRRALAAFVLAVHLLIQQLCSAGTLCDQNNPGVVVLKALKSYPWSYLCLLMTNLLAISGLYDVLEALIFVSQNIGVRAAHRAEPVVLDNWSATFQRRDAVFRLFAVPIILDLVDQVAEPLLMLVLTFPLRNLFGHWLLRAWPVPGQLISIIFTLHLIKWFCQAIDIVYQPIPKPRGVRRPLVIVFLLLCSVFVIRAHWKSLFPATDWEYASTQAYWNADDFPHRRPTNPIRIRRLLSQPAQSVAAIAHRVTNSVLTEWVEPTGHM